MQVKSCVSKGQPLSKFFGTLIGTQSSKLVTYKPWICITKLTNNEMVLNHVESLSLWPSYHDQFPSGEQLDTIRTTTTTTTESKLDERGCPRKPFMDKFNASTHTVSLKMDGKQTRVPVAWMKIWLINPKMEVSIGHPQVRRPRLKTSGAYCWLSLNYLRCWSTTWADLTVAVSGGVDSLLAFKPSRIGDHIGLIPTTKCSLAILDMHFIGYLLIHF